MIVVKEHDVFINTILKYTKYQLNGSKYLIFTLEWAFINSKRKVCLNFWQWGNKNKNKI